MQLPVLQLPQLTALDCRCCGAFPSDVSLLPQLQTLGISAPFAAAWHVAIDHQAPTNAAALQSTRADKVSDGDAATAEDSSVSASAAAAVASKIADAAAAVACTTASPATAAGERTPVLSAAVLQMLDNDIATPTRGQTWKIYCKM